MSKYVFAKRLKILIEHENNLCVKEALIAKNLSRNEDGLSKVHRKILQQLMELKSCEMEVIKLKRMNKKLSKFLEEEHLQLQQDKIQLDEFHGKTIERRQERQRLLTEMDKLRFFKSSTQCFINSKRLPESIQGAVVCEKENYSHLIPIQIDPKQHSHDDARDMLWGLTEQSESLNEHWHELIIGYLDSIIPSQKVSGMEQKTLE